MENNALVLATSASHCVLYPAFGACLGAWTLDSQHLLHAATVDDFASGDPLRMSSFPLVPYSNRIGQARFNWGGARVQLARNFVPEPHAIHGVGWKRKWDVIAQSAAQVTLGYTHMPDIDWRWAFTAEQILSLTETTLTLRLRARNDHDAPVPLGFGHHPYFDAAGARLRFDADAVWLSGADALPSVRVVPGGDFNFSEGPPVAGRAIDHCYDGWRGQTRIAWQGRRYALDIAATNLPAAVVYIPQGGDAFCFEPVPHVNNALNMPGAESTMPVVAPKAWFESSIVMRAVAV